MASTPARSPTPKDRRRRPGSATSSSLPAMSPGRLLSLAHRHLRAGLVRALEAAGHPISVETWTVLAALGEEDGLTQLELGSRVGKNRHHMSRLVDGLEAQGLVVRVAEATDKRVKRVLLTRAGRRARRRLAPLVARYQAEVFAGVSKGDYAAFIRCLEYLVRSLGPSTPSPKEEEP